MGKSFNKFKALLKFEFMSNSYRYRDEKLFSRIKKVIIALLGIAFLELIFIYAINIVMNVFIEENMQHEFLSIFSLFMILLHLVVGVSMATKILYTKVDLSLLKLPVNGLNVFSAKFIYMYFKELFYSLVITLPVLIMFGIKASQGTLYFVLMTPIALVFPLVPFMLSIFLSVPVMYIIRIFKNRFFILLIFYTLLVVMGFLIYIVSLKFILAILDSGRVTDVFDSATILKIKNFSAKLYLPMLFKNCFLFYNFWRSGLIILAIIVCLLLLLWLFAEKCYFNFIISSKNQKNFQRKTKVVHQSITRALMSKEFKNIFRSTNYAFQYFTVVITTPLMVYFSSEIASSVGAPLLGEGVLPGIVVLILIMFLSMGTSFSATSITREGGVFYLSKIVPVSFTKQILVKLEIYLFISVPTTFISTMILALAGFINYLSAALIAISLSFVIIGNICHSITMDITRPQFQYLENGEVTQNNKNISASIGIGFIISFIIGVVGIVLSIFVGIPSMYMVMFGFGVPFVLIEIYRLFHHLEKRYDAIEV